jgi:uncharacterized Zn finger protein
MKPRKIKDLQARSKELAVRVIDPVYPGDPYIMVVNSGTRTTLNRIVSVKFERDGTINARCTCRWAQFGGAACTHVIASLQKLAERKKRKLSFWLTSEEAHRQKQSLFRLRNGGDDIWITSRRPEMKATS